MWPVCGNDLGARRGLSQFMRLLLLCEGIACPTALRDSCDSKTLFCQVVFSGSAFHH